MNDVARARKLVRRIPCAKLVVGGDEEPLLTREWIVTNGLGGYASGTIGGVPTRRYHGLLVAALPSPLGRVVMLNHLYEIVRLADRSTIIGLGGEERRGMLEILGAGHLEEFRLEHGLPVWRYQVGDVVLEKRVLLPYQQNTVHVRYRMLDGPGPLRLKLRPSMHFRPHESPVSAPLPAGGFVVTAKRSRYEITTETDLPPLRLAMLGARASFTLEEQLLPEFLYRVEQHRGYEAKGDMWSPGHFRVDLDVGHDATLVASTEPWETIETLSPEEAFRAEHERREALLAKAHPEARAGVAAELVLAADQFIVTPAGRVEDATRAHAIGDEIRTVIAGYHWFTDWGRDTMISLEGLTLVTGREAEAGYILRTFAHYVRDGLIPNMFPEGGREGLYHTADATLWFFHAVHRYVARTGDRATLRRILGTLKDVYAHHVRGTRFGIGVDRDGLLRQGAAGYQLTWMDAKVDEWVVTPRRGKAVEINALWYDALRLLARWLAEEGDADAAQISELADRAYASFNARFWSDALGYLYDVVDGEDGDDRALRPNQLFAMSLDHPVLDPKRWPAVLGAVERELLTPVGLRSLAPGHTEYKARYYGDLRARDAAYHQGTVWGWLIGPFVDAWLRVHPGDLAGARRRLEPLVAHLGEAGIGTISEVFDADPPFTPRACIAQAWSVAELLRCWVATSAGAAP